MAVLVGLAWAALKAAVAVFVGNGGFVAGIIGVRISVGSGALIVQALTSIANTVTAKMILFMGKILHIVISSVAEPNHTSVNGVCQSARTYWRT
jgi:hypothetical protein